MARMHATFDASTFLSCLLVLKPGTKYDDLRRFAFVWRQAEWRGDNHVVHCAQCFERFDQASGDFEVGVGQHMTQEHGIDYALFASVCIYRETQCWWNNTGTRKCLPLSLSVLVTLVLLSVPIAAIPGWFAVSNPPDLPAGATAVVVRPGAVLPMHMIYGQDYCERFHSRVIRVCDGRPPSRTTRRCTTTVCSGHGSCTRPTTPCYNVTEADWCACPRFDLNSALCSELLARDAIPPQWLVTLLLVVLALTTGHAGLLGCSIVYVECFSRWPLWWPKLRPGLQLCPLWVVQLVFHLVLCAVTSKLSQHVRDAEAGYWRQTCMFPPGSPLHDLQRNMSLAAGDSNTTLRYYSLHDFGFNESWTVYWRRDCDAQTVVSAVWASLVFLLAAACLVFAQHIRHTTGSLAALELDVVPLPPESRPSTRVVTGLCFLDALGTPCLPPDIVMSVLAMLAPAAPTDRDERPESGGLRRRATRAIATGYAQTIGKTIWEDS